MARNDLRSFFERSEALKDHSKLALAGTPQEAKIVEGMKKKRSLSLAHDLAIKIKHAKQDRGPGRARLAVTWSRSPSTCSPARGSQLTTGKSPSRRRAPVRTGRRQSTPSSWHEPWWLTGARCSSRSACSPRPDLGGLTLVVVGVFVVVVVRLALTWLGRRLG